VLQVPLFYRALSAVPDGSQSIPEESVFKSKRPKEKQQSVSHFAKTASISLPATVMQEPNYLAAGPGNIIIRFLPIFVPFSIIVDLFKCDLFFVNFF
jgi:hypothetical protein